MSEMPEGVEQQPAEYYSGFHNLHFTEAQIHKALERYWRWCEEYGVKPKFQAERNIAELKDDPELVGHIVTRAELMGFKTAA